MNFENLDGFSYQKILVFGDFMVDEYIDGNVNRISPEAPVPVLDVRSIEKRLGGAGNVVANLRTLGASVRVLSCIGDDDDGKWLNDELTKLSVDTTYLKQEKARSTIIKIRIVSRFQQFIRLDKERIAPPRSGFSTYVSDNINKILNGISAIIISDYGKGIVTSALSQALIQTAKENNILIIVDPKGNDYSKYTGATLCTPNTYELEVAVGKKIKDENDISEIAGGICRKLDFQYVVVTRAEKGISLVRSNGNKKDFSVTPKEVVDVTGAGDTVTSVLTLGLTLGLPIEECCVLANQAASIVVSQFGVVPVSISELTLEPFLDGSLKQINAEKASLLAKYFKEIGKKTVFTNGCFDILHAGHITSFIQARKLGEILFVGLNSDASVKRIKGKNRPIIDEKKRAKLLRALTYVDYVIIFDEDTPSNLIKKIQPDVVVKGKDWEKSYMPEKEVVQKYGGKVVFVDFEKGLSSTSIIEKIRNA